MARFERARDLEWDLQQPPHHVTPWNEFLAVAEATPYLIKPSPTARKYRAFWEDSRVGRVDWSGWTETSVVPPILYGPRTFGQADWHRYSYRTSFRIGPVGAIMPVESKNSMRPHQDFPTRWEAYIDKLQTEVLDPGYALPSEIEFQYFLDHHYHELAQALRDTQQPADVVARLVYMISHLDWDFVAPRVELLQFTAKALRHSQVFVQQIAVGAFEHWRGPIAQNALQGFDSSQPWLNEYVSRVRAELAEELLANGVPSSENY